MSKFVDRIKVLASSFVTWLVALGAIVNAALIELEPYRNVEVVGVLLKWGGVAASIIAVAVAIVRGVVRVGDPELRGLLLPEDVT